MDTQHAHFLEGFEKFGQREMVGTVHVGMLWRAITDTVGLYFLLYVAACILEIMTK